MVAQALYNEGRTFAKGNQPEKAIASLKESVDAGFIDDKTMTGDLGLATLRDLPDYKAIVVRVKDTRKKAMKAQDDAMTGTATPRGQEATWRRSGRSPSPSNCPASTASP